MGAIWDFISGKQYEENQRYTREHQYEDSSSRSSRPRRVKYRAYCKKCGASTLFTYTSRAEAVKELQQGMIGIYSGTCGNYKHFGETEEVEE